MHIVREGTVIFRNGRIAEINHFEIEDGTQADLHEYVHANYRFTPAPPRTMEEELAPAPEPPKPKKR
jgi:hypothetical protein